MINLGKEKSEINVISDQIGCPTYGQDIAKVILEIIDQYNMKNASWYIYNYTGKDKVSWYEFAKESLKLIKLSTQATNHQTLKRVLLRTPNLGL